MHTDQMISLLQLLEREVGLNDWTNTSVWTRKIAASWDKSTINVVQCVLVIEKSLWLPSLWSSWHPLPFASIHCCGNYNVLKNKPGSPWPWLHRLGLSFPPDVWTRLCFQKTNHRRIQGYQSSLWSYRQGSPEHLCRGTESPRSTFLFWRLFTCRPQTGLGCTGNPPCSLPPPVVSYLPVPLWFCYGRSAPQGLWLCWWKNFILSHGFWVRLMWWRHLVWK